MKITTGNKKIKKRVRELLDNEQFIQEYESILKLGTKKAIPLYNFLKKYKLDFHPLVFHDIYLNKDFSYPYWDTKDIGKINNSHDEFYPVSVEISPLASQRELIEFIKHNWKELRDRLNRYGKQTKYRERKKRERDRFIYENKNLPTEILDKEIVERFGEHISYSDINTIIRNEKKRQKKITSLDK